MDKTLFRPQLSFEHNMENSKKRSKLDILDIEKLKAQHQAGLSIRQLSLLWDIPYASLHRALKGEKKKKKNRTGEQGRAPEREAMEGNKRNL